MKNAGRLAKGLAKARSFDWVSRALGRSKPVKMPEVEDSEPRPPLPVSHGEMLWFHADGPEELSDLEELIDRLADQKDPPTILMTSRVLAAGNTASKRFPDLISLAQCPNEDATSITRFLDHWGPCLCLWLGGSYAPNLISATVGRRIPMINANAVLSTDGWLRNRMARRSLRAMVDKFDRVFAKDDVSRDAFVALGLSEDKVVETGPLLTAQQPPDFNEQLHAKLDKHIGSRPVWLASNVQSAELDKVLAAQQDAARLTHRLLLILHPSDADDGPKFAEALAAADVSFVRRSLGDVPRHETVVVLDDTPDEQGLWLRIAPLAFLGRSLVAGGTGSDPMIAAALGSAIIHGPEVSGYKDSYDKLSDVGATVCVETAKSLTEAVCELSFPDVAARMAYAAWQVESRSSDMVEAVEMDILTRIGRNTEPA
jgi:3-deoxy-D-manno-octulosonic-acid transferase